FVAPLTSTPPPLPCPPGRRLHGLVLPGGNRAPRWTSRDHHLVPLRAVSSPVPGSGDRPRQHGRRRRSVPDRRSGLRAHRPRPHYPAQRLGRPRPARRAAASDRRTTLTGRVRHVRPPRPQRPNRVGFRALRPPPPRPTHGHPRRRARHRPQPSLAGTAHPPDPGTEPPRNRPQTAPRTSRPPASHHRSHHRPDRHTGGLRQRRYAASPTATQDQI